MSRQDRHEHERARQLAALAIDYGLTVTQAADLDAHLVTCPACARSAAAMRGDAIALQPRTAPLPSRRVDDAVAAAIAGRRATSSSMLVLIAAVLLLIALLGVAAAAGSLLSFVTVSEPLAQGRFDAVFLRPPAEGNPTGPSTVWAVGPDGTERLLASVPGVATDLMAFGQRMALSQAGHLALLVRGGDRVSWAILDLTNPGATPIPVVLPGPDDSPGFYSPGFALWGPGERLAIVLSPQSDNQVFAFIDPATGAATVHPISLMEYGCFADRCSVWAADGSGVVIVGPGNSSGPEILTPDGRVAPLGSRLSPSNIGARDVNAAGDGLGTNSIPMDGFSRLSAHAAGGMDDRWALMLGDVELSDRAWAADGRDAWLLTAEWLATSRPVTLERFSPPSTRTVIASFVAAVDVPAKDSYRPAAWFAGIAPDDSLAVVEVAMTTPPEPFALQGKLVDLRSGTSTDVDGSFVGWLASRE